MLGTESLYTQVFSHKWCSIMQKTRPPPFYTPTPSTFRQGFELRKNSTYVISVALINYVSRGLVVLQIVFYTTVLAF